MITTDTRGKAKGRHPHNALSAQFVRNAKGPGFYPDGNGLYLKVEKSGARRWVQRIMIRGRRRDLALGPVSLVTLAEARESAIENRKVARGGGDPAAERRRLAEIPTFAEAARTVYDIHRPSWRNPKHAAQFISTLETYAFPHLGRVSVADIDGSHVLAALTPIWLTKPETARRVRQRIGVVLKWAVAKGWRSDNPSESIAQVLPRQRAKVRHRKALPYGEVANCIEAVRDSDANPTTKLALEFLILTAVRSGEVRGARWGEVDADRAVWSIPEPRMKTGKAHRVPLSGRALEIIEAAKTYRGNGDLLFPSAQRGRQISDATLLKLVREQGFNCDIHGFRTSFKTWTQEQTNTARDVSEAALAHVVKDAAEAAYARSDFFEKRRKLMQRWADYLDSRQGSIVSIDRKAAR